MRKLVTTYKLPPVEFHPIVGGYEVDFRIIDSNIVLECDGWETHGRNKRQFEKDRTRDADLIGRGNIVVRFTYRAITRTGGEGGRTHPARWSARGRRTCFWAGILPTADKNPAQIVGWRNSRPDGGRGSGR